MVYILYIKKPRRGRMYNTHTKSCILIKVYHNRCVSFRAAKVFSYRKNAKKKAEEHIDNKYFWTKASTGDVCMLFAVDELKV